MVVGQNVVVCVDYYVVVEVGVLLFVVVEAIVEEVVEQWVVYQWIVLCLYFLGCEDMYY